MSLFMVKAEKCLTSKKSKRDVAAYVNVINKIFIYIIYNKAHQQLDSSGLLMQQAIGRDSLAQRSTNAIP
jgi:hypothetical protein